MILKYYLQLIVKTRQLAKHYPELTPEPDMYEDMYAWQV